MARYHNRSLWRSDDGIGTLTGWALIVLIVGASLIYAMGAWVAIPIALIIFICSRMRS